jgi:hypothetical protein
MTIPNKIDRYLVDTVDRIRPTVTAGLRTEDIASDLRARIVNRTRVVRDVSGDQIITKMLIYLLPDADVLEGDELVADTLHRPVVGVIEARDKQGNVHHLEVALG